MTNMVEVRVGARVWFDAEIWVVDELGHDRSRLVQGERVRVCSTVGLLATARVIQESEPSSLAKMDDPPNVLLSNLTESQRARLDHKASVARELLDVTDHRPVQDRLTALAAREGVSARTLERWAAGYRRAGVAGLADARVTRRYTSSVDPRWDRACLGVLGEFTSRSTPTMNVVLDRVQQRLTEEHGEGVVPCPSQSTGYRRLRELAKGRHAFGSGKQRRSVAQRPQGPYGRLRATRPGEYVVLDTTPLDVFAMEPVTLRWVPVELTVAQDLFTRCILGLRLSPVSTCSADVANVLYQCIVPQPKPTDDGAWPFHGIPRNVLVGTEVPDGVSQERVAGLPACLPEAIVVDHGKVYISKHVTSACARLGIIIQPAIPHKPTDKPTVERFFKTVREGLLQHLPGYKGPDVYNRGKNVEADAFYYVAELEQIIREWVGQIYHRTKHDGLCVP